MARPGAADAGMGVADFFNIRLMETVRTIDLTRYMGRWYEIARLEQWYERGLVGVTATYTLRPDGTVSVLNEGCEGSLSGRRKMAAGRAYVVDPAEPGHLRVAFLLWFYADYWILELDTVNYGYALVGGGRKRDALWVLSRTPTLPQETVRC